MFFATCKARECAHGALVMTMHLCTTTNLPCSARSKARSPKPLHTLQDIIIFSNLMQKKWRLPTSGRHENSYGNIGPFWGVCIVVQCYMSIWQYVDMTLRHRGSFNFDVRKPVLYVDMAICRYDLIHRGSLNLDVRKPVLYVEMAIFRYDIETSREF